MVRARESSLILLAALVGVVGGLVVAAMGKSVDLLHELFFRLEPGERLSAQLTLDPILALSVPLFGGLVFGIAGELSNAGDRSGKSTRSRRMRCTAAGCRSSAASSLPRRQCGRAAWALRSGSKRATRSSQAGSLRESASVPPAPRRPSHPGRLRRRRWHRRRFRRAARRRFLWLRADHRQLLAGRPCPGRSLPRRFLVARAFEPADSAPSRPTRQRSCPRPCACRDAWAAGCGARHHPDARGRAVRGHIRAHASPADAAHHGRRPIVGLMAMVSPQVMSSGHGALRIIGMLDLPLDPWRLCSCSRSRHRSCHLVPDFAAGCFFPRC